MVITNLSSISNHIYFSLVTQVLFICKAVNISTLQLTWFYVFFTTADSDGQMLAIFIMYSVLRISVLISVRLGRRWVSRVIVLHVCPCSKTDVTHRRLSPAGPDGRASPMSRSGEHRACSDARPLGFVVSPNRLVSCRDDLRRPFARFAR